jgi:uncharacterized membrane protein YcaP (DUF421 family)
VLLLIVDVLRNGIVGIDNTVAGAFVGAVTGLAVTELLGRAAQRSSLGLRLLRSNSSVLIRNGEPMPKALFQASISLPELREIARREGFAELSEVQSATLQRNGIVTLRGHERPHRTPAAGFGPTPSAPGGHDR